MRKFKDEFTVSLSDIDRNWLRRFALIGVIIPSFLMFLFLGVFIGTYNFFYQIYETMRYYFVNFIIDVWKKN